MNEMMENKYPYDNWKSITESDFVTLFIKTWFAFVSTLREMYPAEIPYYQATGDSRYLWFISFVYRLRNALFHEIIDPLNDEWQVIFKNSYHVLKQVVDQNIWRLKQLKLLPSASQAAAEKDYNREPPPDIDWPTDEEAKFTWFYYEMLKLNKDGARVLLKGKIDFTEHHYETECTVRWNESLSETAIKNASITRVVESQEKELAAAI